MYGKTANSQQFMAREASHSTKGSRRGFSLLGGGDDPTNHLSKRQQRESLVLAWKNVNARLKEPNLTAKERNELGQAQFSIQKKLEKLRARIKMENFNDYFIDAARAELSRIQFDRIRESAKREYDAATNWSKEP